MKLTRITAFLLAFVMVLGCLPLSALAEAVPSETLPAETAPQETAPAETLAEETPTEETLTEETQPVLDTQPQFSNVAQVNPLYADVLSADELVPHQDPGVELMSSASDPYTFAEAAAYLRGIMRQRTVSTGYIYYLSDTSNLDDLVEAATAHTGEPTEGDYLKWQYGGYTGRRGDYGVQENGQTLLKIDLTFTYYTTAAQEQTLDDAVRNLLAYLNPTGTDYEKFRTIYDYICDNVSYDYENLYDDSYKLKYSAYAALINKTAVCQGFANLLYRLCLELGIDCRLISGTGNGGGHGWNIVKMEGRYYNADATWDINYAGTHDYAYCLVCPDNFTDHVRDQEYNTAAFHAAYPMGSTDYVPSPPPVGIAIDAVNFPDEIFRGLVRENLDSNSDGILTSAEAGAVTAMDASDLGISSLTGIAHFPNLEALLCSNNPLGALDVSQNLKLEFLDCSFTKISSLDVSRNTALLGLDCYCNSLTTLDVTNNTQLQYLNCRDNLLTQLDVSKNTALTVLDCSSNAIEDLALSGNPALQELYCYSNPLEELNVSSLVNLQYLDCTSTYLSALDVSKNTKLAELGCDYNGLTTIDVSRNTALELLSVFDNELTTLDVSKNTALRGLYVGGNDLTELDLSHNPELTQLDINFCQELTQLDLSKNPGLVYLTCNTSGLTSLDLTKNAALEELYCSGTQIPCLDLSGNPKLNSLSVMNGRLTSLDLSANPHLADFLCEYNSRPITLTGSTFDLSSLPGFDVSKASGWTGGTVSGTTLTLETGATQATYTYDCGQGFTAQFTLTFDPVTPSTVLFRNVSVSLAGDIALNYYMELSQDIVTDPGAFLRFTFDGQTQDVPMSQAIHDAATGWYRFSCKLAAKDMACAVTGQMYTSSGPVGGQRSYSIRDYCSYIIQYYAGTNTQTKLVDLMIAMLNYGAQSQISLKHNTSDLANSSLSAEEKVLPVPVTLAPYALSISGSEAGVALYSASLLLKDTTTIRVYFQLTGDKTIDQFTFTGDGKTLTPVHYSGKVYYVDLVGISARNLDEFYTFTCGGLTLRYCGLSYVKSTMDYSGSTENDRYMARALYGYAMAANAYLDR